MAGRPPLEVGTYGKITVKEANGKWRARTMFRDLDGVTREVERWAETSRRADSALKKALSRRTGPPGNAVTGESKFTDVAERWMENVQQSVERGKKSPGSIELYRRQLDNHVLPALGALRIREITVARLDGFIGELATRKGSATCKMVRTVVSGVMKEAMRHDAITINPTRNISAIESGRGKPPRGLSLEQCQQWVSRLEADEQALHNDLPDLTRFMLATGVRIGEALAVLWQDVDLEAGTVDVEHTIIRVRGVGLVRKGTKTEAGERTLPLPSWAVTMLKRRAATFSHGPVFANADGGWRDPSNTRRDLRQARGSDEFAWVTSHVFRKTAATLLDEAGLSARTVADQLGHSRPSLTQDVYLARKTTSRDAADALETFQGI